ncbi:hypothetical protein MHO82_25190 [Vibrio sp. Of7-15]|uniref:hypothetical protein n=1 Tax=Vibrio sp. Of7-15 TaxID=2724879 RepID=UPI001EF337D4|nr:hypothetical protein [Vibrio sp. Of7-15]MCG7500161.1 hypothetical protein [Vibrio sp. Of7-15]
MKLFKSNNVKVIDSWDEYVLIALLPKEPSAISKKWVRNYRIQIEGIVTKVTMQGIEREIYGHLNIPSLSALLPVKVNICVGSDLEPSLRDEGVFGNFCFGGHINPNCDSGDYLPNLVFNLFLEQEIWDGMRETIENVCVSSSFKAEISFQVNYETKPNPQNFLEERCSDFQSITFFKMQSVKAIDIGNLTKNTNFITDLSSDV